jgi:hypothetical protein
MFAAMLALLCTQPAIPSVRITAAFKPAPQTPSAQVQAEQQKCRNIGADAPRAQVTCFPAPPISSFKPELFYQLPPPSSSRIV